MESKRKKSGVAKEAAAPVMPYVAPGFSPMSVLPQRDPNFVYHMLSSHITDYFRPKETIKGIDVVGCGVCPTDFATSNFGSINPQTKYEAWGFSKIQATYDTEKSDDYATRTALLREWLWDSNKQQLRFVVVIEKCPEKGNWAFFLGSPTSYLVLGNKNGDMFLICKDFYYKSTEKDTREFIKDPFAMSFEDALKTVQVCAFNILFNQLHSNASESESE